MEPIVALQWAVLILMGALILVARLPGECQCDACPTHTGERRKRREEQRARDHRRMHLAFHVKWGDPGCAQCTLGHIDDEHPPK